MIREDYDQLTTEQLQIEFIKLTEHLRLFRHSTERHTQISREIEYVAFELQYRGTRMLNRIGV